jgi:hypothetical protein
MTEGSSDEQLTELNQVLSEVVDVAGAARRARHAIPAGHPLHPEVDRLFSSARSWAAQLVDLDSALGVSALEYMTSPTGRLPSAPQPSPGSNDEVRGALGRQLERLAAHVGAMLAQREDDRVREALDRLSEELQVHLAVFKDED